MKKTIRMNERELNRLISESVKRVLNEGTRYFDKATDYVSGSYPDYGGGYVRDLGYDDTSKAFSKYAKDDMGKKVSGKSYDTLYPLYKQGYLDPEEDPNNEFEANGFIHTARQARKNDGTDDSGYHYNPWYKENALIALRGGASKELLRKLSPKTVDQLAFDLKKQPNLR